VLAQPEPSGVTALRTWLLLFCLTKTAAIGLLLGLTELEGTRRIPELAGWLRRTPLMGAAVLLLLLGSYGLPGLLPFQTRQEILALAVGGPLGWLLLLVSLLPAVGLARLLVVGVRRWRSPEVGPGGWRRWLALPALAPAPASAEFREEYEDAPAIYRERLRRAGATLVRNARYVPEVWSLNRRPATAVLVLLLALIPAALALGAGDLRGAASGPPPIAAGRQEGEGLVP
jgi:hypothetical protein